MSAVGDAVAVAGAAETVRAISLVMTSGTDRVAGARPRQWEGDAADRYDERRAATTTVAYRAADAHKTAAAALSGFADVLTAQSAKHDDAVARFAAALPGVISLTPNPGDVKAMNEAIADAKAAIAGARREGDAVARRLDALFDDAPSGDQPWWDPYGRFEGERIPREDVMPGMLDGSKLDPSQFTQGQLNDCFVLVAAMSLTRTDAGDQFLRDHVRWDAAKGGYWVTLFVDGQATEVFVDKVYGQGVRDRDDTGPSVGALYEAALAQKFGYDYLHFGNIGKAMRYITGADVTDIWHDGDELTSGDWKDVRTALVDGGFAQVGTPKGSPITVDAQWVDESGQQQSGTARILGEHAYMVDRVEADGSVWVVNPHGAGNSLDPGVPFKLSAEDARKVFHYAVYTGKP